ncbi:LacI family transcriptional regulator [Mycetocola sp. CAN_C7]|uniref:LacI family DNA-binding transcriptional regulator n=1 Tax=Mycetocola sp. CAN_C7 TaxID=2787724 RepID=UPI0018CBE200
MTNRTTSYDIALRVGVGQSTVSRALRDDPRISQATRDKVRAAAAELGYIPNLTARSLITGSVRAIGVLVPDLLNPMYAQFVESIQEVLAERDYRMVLLTDRTEGMRDAGIDVLQGGLVDGTIFMQARSDSDLVDMLASAGHRLVVLGRDIVTPNAGGVEVDRVVADDAAAGRLAAEHLLAQGNAVFAVVGGTESNPTSNAREAAFITRLTELGVADGDIAVHHGAVEAHDGEIVLAAMLDSGAVPDAIFCTTDFVALGVLQAAAEAGVAVPETLQVMGVGDMYMTGWKAFGLTTIRQPYADMSRAAATMLLDRIEGQREITERVVKPVELVPRGTTALRVVAPS